MPDCPGKIPSFGESKVSDLATSCMNRDTITKRSRDLLPILRHRNLGGQYGTLHNYNLYGYPDSKLSHESRCQSTGCMGCRKKNTPPKPCDPNIISPREIRGKNQPFDQYYYNTYPWPFIKRGGDAKLVSDEPTRPLPTYYYILDSRDVWVVAEHLEQWFQQTWQVSVPHIVHRILHFAKYWPVVPALTRTDMEVNYVNEGLILESETLTGAGNYPLRKIEIHMKNTACPYIITLGDLNFHLTVVSHDGKELARAPVPMYGYLERVFIFDLTETDTERAGDDTEEMVAIRELLCRVPSGARLKLVAQGLAKVWPPPRYSATYEAYFLCYVDCLGDGSPITRNWSLRQ